MSDMNKAYALAAAAVRQRYREQHPEYLDVLSELKKQDIAVYTGSYDKVETVLDHLQIPYTLNAAVRSWKAFLVFANCPGTNHSGLTKNIANLVNDGTWLVSSDWSLANVVAPHFPDTIRRGQGVSGDEVVGVEPWHDSLWSDIVVLGCDPQWWLEGSSYPIHIDNPEMVKIEAVSHDMLVKYKQSAVAVRFPWGAGEVFHIISHFYLKRTRLAHAKHQSCATDFLREGMKLSEEGIEHVLKTAKLKPDSINFATLQSAATSAELVARLCIDAALSQVQVLA